MQVLFFQGKIPQKNTAKKSIQEELISQTFFAFSTVGRQEKPSGLGDGPTGSIHFSQVTPL